MVEEDEAEEGWQSVVVDAVTRVVATRVRRMGATDEGETVSVGGSSMSRCADSEDKRWTDWDIRGLRKLNALSADKWRSGRRDGGRWALGSGYCTGRRLHCAQPARASLCRVGVRQSIGLPARWLVGS